jgi:hypothetical protein
MLQVVSERSALHLFFFVHVPDKKLGLEPIESLQDQPRRARQQPMGDENKDDGVGDPIKMLLEEALTRQRNEMMDNFEKSFDDCLREKHLHQAVMQPPSRYM